MSEELGAGISPNSRRALWEQVLVRLPFLVNLVAAAISRLAPGAPLRRRFLAKGFRAAWDGINRGDFEPALLAYERDAEVRVFGAAGVGFAERYSGESGWLDLFGDMFESFGDPHFEVRRVLDGGDRVVAEVNLTTSGKASGAPVEGSTTNVYYLSPRGKIARQELFWLENSWERALEAAGLSA
jgi:ketosteroid isomerase-like protein